MINNGFTPDKNDYEFCAKVENMVIPTQGHFGISAATGGLAGKSCHLFVLKACE
jgi:mannose-binding lectin 1